MFSVLGTLYHVKSTFHRANSNSGTYFSRLIILFTVDLMNSSPSFSLCPHDFKVHPMILVIKSHLYNYMFQRYFKRKIKQTNKKKKNWQSEQFSL